MGESAEGRDVLAGGVCGTVAWCIHADGEFVFAPLPGHAVGEFAPDLGRVRFERSTAWAKKPNLVRRVRFGGPCRAPESALGMFHGLAKATAIDLTGLDTSRVTDMRGMFKGCSSLRSLDLSGLDMSRVTDMRGCSKTAEHSARSTSRGSTRRA